MKQQQAEVRKPLRKILGTYSKIQWCRDGRIVQNWRVMLECLHSHTAIEGFPLEPRVACPTCAKPGKLVVLYQQLN